MTQRTSRSFRSATVSLWLSYATDCWCPLLRSSGCIRIAATATLLDSVRRQHRATGRVEGVQHLHQCTGHFQKLACSSGLRAPREPCRRAPSRSAAPWRSQEAAAVGPRPVVDQPRASLREAPHLRIRTLVRRGHGPLDDDGLHLARAQWPVAGFRAPGPDRSRCFSERPRRWRRHQRTGIYLGWNFQVP